MSCSASLMHVASIAKALLHLFALTSKTKTDLLYSKFGKSKNICQLLHFAICDLALSDLPNIYSFDYLISKYTLSSKAHIHLNQLAMRVVCSRLWDIKMGVVRYQNGRGQRSKRHNSW